MRAPLSSSSSSSSSSSVASSSPSAAAASLQGSPAPSTTTATATAALLTPTSSSLVKDRVVLKPAFEQHPSWLTTQAQAAIMAGDWLVHHFGSETTIELESEYTAYGCPGFALRVSGSHVVLNKSVTDQLETAWSKWIRRPEYERFAKLPEYARFLKLMQTGTVEVVPREDQVAGGTRLDGVIGRPDPPEGTTEAAASLPTFRLQGFGFTQRATFHAFETYKQTLDTVDHRRQGAQQKLFFVSELSPGSPFFLPHGTRVLERLFNLARREYFDGGYSEVVTPQLFKDTLWKTSGHLENYQDDMYFVGKHEQGSSAASGSAEEAAPSPTSSAISPAPAPTPTVDPETSLTSGVMTACHEHANHATTSSSLMGLKPMNCPGHCVLFDSVDVHSFRNLPVRYAELSPLHRAESSGSLSGLFRVRRFHQDDAHVFCRVDQVKSEIASIVDSIRRVNRLFDLTPQFYLSTRPDQYIGSPKIWKAAEAALAEVLDEAGVSWSVREGDGAFYGPKIDVVVRDVLQRPHQTSTVQLDFNLPERFRLAYQSPEQTMERPVLIHRALFGSLERLMGILIEHYAQSGWPFWLSPRQVVVVPLHPPTHSAYAAQVLAQLRAIRGPLGPVHARLDQSDRKLGKVVREAMAQRVNVVAIVGDHEMQNNVVTLRLLGLSQYQSPDSAPVRQIEVPLGPPLAAWIEQQCQPQPIPTAASTPSAANPE